MKLFKTIKRFLWRRIFWVALFFLMLAINGIVVLMYTSDNRSQLIYNPIVKSGLPFYRVGRDVVNSIIDSAYVFAMRRDVGIPQYRLEVKTDDLRKLNNALPSSLSDDVISGATLFTAAMEDTVKGIFHYDGHEYEVGVRYRGQNANHWTRPKKSWQIKFDKDTPFNGIRTLKLIIPDDRGYFAEALNNYRAGKLGLVFPQAEFAQLYVNNDYHGVYFAVEDFSPEFLERSQKPADANIYATSDDEALISGDESMTSFDGIDLWHKESEDKIFNFENFAELDFLLTLMQSDDFSKVAGDIIDMESFYAWNAVAILAGSNHQSSWGNMRLYFNNTKGKFEFLPWDVGVKSYLPTQLTNTLTEKILSDPEFYLMRNQKLWDYVSDKENLNDDLRYYDGLYDQLKGAFYSDFKKHDNNITFNRTAMDIRSQYISLFERLRGLFSEDRVALTVRHDANKKLLSLSFDMDSFAGLNLEAIMFPDGAQPISDAHRYLFNASETVEVRYSGDVIDDVSQIEYKLTNAITGEPVEIDSIQFSDLSTFVAFSDISATVDEFVTAHPLFRKQGNGIVLPPGAYVFTSDIIVPKNMSLRIEAGVTAYFGPDASLVSHSPATVAGTALRPVVFRRFNPNEPWGSFAVLNTGKNISVLEYLDADGGSSDYINGAFLSGMVSVYYSDVRMSNTTITRSASDDGVNFKYAAVSITDSTFRNNSADGLDVDYVTGTIEGNVFIDNGNDGIDLSGSKVMIRNNRITGSGDKCISIGEQSVGTAVVNTVMDSCNIGIEVKDNSSVPIADSVIINNAIGINAYMKKPLFKSGGKVDVYHSVFENNGTQTQTDEYSEIVDHGNETFDLEQI